MHYIRFYSISAPSWYASLKRNLFGFAAFATSGGGFFGKDSRDEFRDPPRQSGHKPHSESHQPRKCYKPDIPIHAVEHNLCSPVRFHEEWHGTRITVGYARSDEAGTYHIHPYALTLEHSTQRKAPTFHRGLCCGIGWTCRKWRISCNARSKNNLPSGRTYTSGCIPAENLNQRQDDIQISADIRGERPAYVFLVFNPGTDSSIGEYNLKRSYCVAFLKPFADCHFISDIKHFTANR